VRINAHYCLVSGAVRGAIAVHLHSCGHTVDTRKSGEARRQTERKRKANRRQSARLGVRSEWPKEFFGRWPEFPDHRTRNTLAWSCSNTAKLDSVDDRRMALRIRGITAPCNFPQRTTTADIVGDQPCRCANNVQTRSNGIETYQVNPWSRWPAGPCLCLCLCPCRCRRSQQRLPQRESRPKRRVLFSLEFPFLSRPRCTLRASLYRWSPAEANGSPAPVTVGHFKEDCVLGDTVTRRAQQNPPESGSRSAPRHPPLPVYFRAEFE